jgi:hypothetical protein
MPEAQRCKFYENGIWNGNTHLTRRRSDLMARTDYIFLYETPRSIIGVKQDGFTLHQWVFSATRRTLSRESDWQTAAQTPAIPNNGNDENEHEDHTICPNCSECIDCDDCHCWECEGCGRRRDDDNNRCEHCEHCEQCCTCSRCRACGHTADTVCECCEHCPDCCECFICQNCGERVRDICGECECCEYCGCQCHSNAPRHNQHFKIEKPANLTGYKINRLRRPIAIELELSSVGDSSELLRWARASGAGLVEDGSIPESGCEINTNPAAGDYLISAMEALARALSSSDADVDHSCGLHVHVDASDYTQYDLRRLIMLWAATERAMFDIAGARRISNTYCHPASEQYIQALTCGFDSKIFRKTLVQSLYNRIPGRTIPEYKTDRYNRARYYALNLHSFFYRKTIEFRLHEAKTSVSVLRNWPRVCGQIVEFALKHSERELKRQAKYSL